MSLLLLTMAAYVPTDPPEIPDFIRERLCDGDYECQCARCGSSLDWVNCSWCDGGGRTAFGELHEEDPLWYDEDDTEPCHQCGGEGSWPVCLSRLDWCRANPMPGRHYVESGTAEWFKVSNAP